MEHSYKNYDFHDVEEPDKVFKKFDEKIARRFHKEKNPVVKPKDVFVGGNFKKFKIKKTKIKEVVFGQMWLK